MDPQAGGGGAVTARSSAEACLPAGKASEGALRIPGEGRAPGRAAFLAVLAVVITTAPPAAFSAELAPDELRSSVLLIRTERELASCVVVDGERGLVATSRSAIRGGGRIVVSFLAKKEHAGTQVPTYEQVPLGEALPHAVHRRLDLALLRLKVPIAALIELKAAEAAAPAPGLRVRLLCVEGGVELDRVRHVVTSSGKLLEADEDVLRFDVPTHLAARGGALVGERGELLGVASYEWGSDSGLAVRADVVRGLVDGLERELSEAAREEWVREGSSPPKWLPLSPTPGGPQGERVDFGKAYVVKGTRTILLPGVVCLDGSDLLEYFACPEKRGKLHESVVALAADPAAVGVALIALKYEPGGGVERLGDPRRPRGDELRMEVEWDWNQSEAIRRYLNSRPRSAGHIPFSRVRELVESGGITWGKGPVVRVRAEDLIFNTAEGHPMVHTRWIYTGSGLVRDPETGRSHFKATMEGVFAAVYRDPSAVLNIPLKTAEDDTYYTIRGSVVPARGTSCTVILSPAERD